MDLDLIRPAYDFYKKLRKFFDPIIILGASITICFLIFVSVYFTIISYSENDPDEARLHLLILLGIGTLIFGAYRTYIADQEKESSKVVVEYQRINDSDRRLLESVKLIQSWKENDQNEFSGVAGISLIGGCIELDPDKTQVGIDIACYALPGSEEGKQAPASIYQAFNQILKDCGINNNVSFPLSGRRLDTCYLNLAAGCSKIVLDRAILSKCIFSGDFKESNVAATFANFRLCDFSKSTQRQQNFSDSEFESCDFSGATLLECSFAGATFSELSSSDAVSSNWFSGGNLTGSNFEDAILVDANFFETTLNNVNFRGADCRGAKFNGAKFNDLVNLDNAKLEGADLRGAQGLTFEHLLQATGDAETKIPPDLDRPSLW